MSNKRELLTKTALDLFYKNGINSVGINEILKVSGVAKKTLYNYFGSKEELVLFKSFCSFDNRFDERPSVISKDLKIWYFPMKLRLSFYDQES